ncbi:Coatomer subunit zeta-1 [Glycine max]|nr:Coatomer subunit zeta-1 [Glycine max]
MTEAASLQALIRSPADHVSRPKVPRTPPPEEDPPIAPKHVLPASCPRSRVSSRGLRKGVQWEERLHWRSFLVKLGADNLKGVKNEELLVACHKSVYIVYTVLGDVSIYVVGKEEYDELALSEVIFVITSAVKDVCGKPPSERLFLDKYGRICLCLDEIVWKGYLENTEKDRIKRLVRLKPPTEF